MTLLLPASCGSASGSLAAVAHPGRPCCAAACPAGDPVARAGRVAPHKPALVYAGAAPRRQETEMAEDKVINNGRIWNVDKHLAEGDVRLVPRMMGGPSRSLTKLTRHWREGF
jgi:hypothetical protein